MSKNKNVHFSDPNEESEEDEYLFKSKLAERIISITFYTLVVTMLVFLLVFVILVRARLIRLVGISLYSISLISFFIIIIISAVTSAIFYKYTKPLHDVSVASCKVAKGDFSVRVKDERDESPDDEVTALIRNFNGMVQELSKIETLKTDFISNVSHEIKTPLASIQGYATLLQDETLSEEERRNYTELIIGATKRLTLLTSNILKLSKLENQTLFLQKKAFCLDEQLRVCVLQFEDQWMKKNLELDVDLEPIEIIGDEELYFTVWSNLIGNAVKFSHEGGILRIQSYLEGKRAVVKITDTGVGMDEETLSHIFDKFYQAEDSHASEGNGLGLALVKRIAELTESEIEAVSEKNKGTTFTVRIKTE